MSDDHLLASILRKLITQGCYYDHGPAAVCLDGWVSDLTADEVAAFERLVADDV